MRAVLIVGLVVLVGCGKRDDAGSDTAPARAPQRPAKPDFELRSVDAISDAFRDNPAAADKNFKGKVGLMPMQTTLERASDETVLRYVRAVAVKNPRQPDIAFHFISEDEAAKMEKAKMYMLEEKCEGLKDGVVVFTGTRIIGEFTPPPVKN